MPEKREDKEGILQTAGTEKAVIDGNIYPVADIVKPFISKMKANSKVHYSIKSVDGVETLVFISKAGEKKQESKAPVTEHTERSQQDIAQERDNYNTAGRAKTAPASQSPLVADNNAKPAGNTQQTPTVPQREVSEICKECLEYKKCKILDPSAGCGIATQGQSQEPIVGAVSLGIHINLGSYCNFDIKVEGATGDHARALLVQESKSMLPVVASIMKEAAKMAEKMRYD